MNFQCDLSEIFIPPQALLRAGGIFQGLRSIDDRFQCSSRDQLHHFFEFVQRAHGRANNAEMFGEHITVVNFELWSAAVPDRQEPTPLAQGTQALHEGRADVIHNNVHTALVRGEEDCFRPILFL